MRRLKGLVRERKIQIVHTHSPYMGVGARLALNPRRGLLLVHTEHNVWESYHPLTRRGNLMTFPSNDHVFAVSRHVRDSIRYPAALRFMRMPPVETLYHGLDPASIDGWSPEGDVRRSLGVPPGAPLVGTVANFRLEKGHSYLLQAAVEVRRVLPEARFVLVGQGPLEQPLRKQVASLQLEDSVIFAGTRSDVPRLTASFDIFALPSIHEGLSIALIEALAVGTPAVVTRTGGITEVVSDGATAIVVPPRDPDALASAIVALLTDKELRLRLSRAGKVRAAQFDIRVATRRIESLYREILA